MSRSTPFDLVFGALAEDRFPAIRDSLARSGADPADRDRFVLDAQAAGLLRELVPEQGAGASVSEHLALLHHAYLYWASGLHTASLTRRDATALLSARQAPGSTFSGARYIQFPERLVWAETEPGAPHEPLDGVFVHRSGADGLAALAVFGFHPTRMGFSVVTADGAPPDELARSDGTALFAPVLPGGSAAGLFSVTGTEELLELAARAAAIPDASRKEPLAG
jgi:hypothetical protein